MCSKCYRDLRGNQQTTSSGAPKVELQLPNSAQSSANSSAFATPAPTLPIGISSALGADARLSSSAPPLVVPSGATADSPKAARARHACASCNKNVGLLGSQAPFFFFFFARYSFGFICGHFIVFLKKRSSFSSDFIRIYLSLRERILRKASGCTRP